MAAVRYLVVAVCQSGAKAAPSGHKVFVLFVGLADTLEIVIPPTTNGSSGRHSEHIANLGAFRIEKVSENSCPRSAWRWGRNSPLDCSDLLDRCNSLRKQVTDSARKKPESQRS